MLIPYVQCTRDVDVVNLVKKFIHECRWGERAASECVKEICAAVGSFGFATIVTKWPRNKIRYALGFIMIPLS